MRGLAFLAFLGACSASNGATPPADPVMAARQACAERPRGVDGNTMTAPYDDCIAEFANRSSPEDRPAICRLAAAGRMIGGRCEIDAE